MIHFYNPFSNNQYNYASQDISYGRWVSYYNQINEILKLGKVGDKILEIGPGEKVTHDVLKRLGFKITTVDIDENKHPDVCSDIRSLNILPSSYDIIACFEVLEHIPYIDFSAILSKFYSATNKYCIISLPTFGFEFVVTFKFPKIPKVNAFQPFGRNLTLSAIICLPIPMKKRPLPFHQWEIGRARYPLQKIKKDILCSGFSIKKYFHIPEHPWFTFFILEK